MCTPGTFKGFSVFNKCRLGMQWQLFMVSFSFDCNCLQNFQSGKLKMKKTWKDLQPTAHTSPWKDSSIPEINFNNFLFLLLLLNISTKIIQNISTFRFANSCSVCFIYNFHVCVLSFRKHFFLLFSLTQIICKFFSIHSSFFIQFN